MKIPKVSVNREALYKLLKYVYNDEFEDWGLYQNDDEFDLYKLYKGENTPKDHIFWAIHQLAEDAKWHQHRKNAF